MSVVEAGHVSRLTIDRLRRLLAALDARIELVPRWRGADLDRLIDEAHAVVVAQVARRLARARWTPVVEVTYSAMPESSRLRRLFTSTPILGRSLPDDAGSSGLIAEGDGRG